MARKTPTISQEELYLQPDEPVREELDDARLLDLDAEEESPFLRGQKRVSVRRGSLPKKTAARLTWAALALAIVFLSGIAVASLYHSANAPGAFEWNRAMTSKLMALRMSAARR